VCLEFLINLPGVFMSFIFKVSLPVLLVLSVSACQKPADTDSTAKSGSIETVSAPSVALQPTTTKGKNGILAVTPGTSNACEPAFVAKISFDLAGSNPEVKTLSVFIKGPADSEPKLFAQVGRSGSLETGPWARPGLLVSLEDADTHTQIDDVEISGPKCI